MRKYIRSVVLICALNGVGVWAEAPCAFKIIDPDFGPWPAQSTGTEYYQGVGHAANYCEKSRGYQTCARGDSVGWNGYYCNNGPDRHHKERTDGKQWGPLGPCPHAGRAIVKSAYGPTKLLSKNPCSYYNNP